MSKYPPAIAKQKKSKNGNPASSQKFDFPWNRVSEKEIVDFTRGMAVMVKANIPLVKALDTAINQAGDGQFGNILKQVRKDIKGGMSLAKSLAKHEKIFDELYIHLVEVGEVAGILGEILFRLSGYMEKQHSLKKKVRMALVYPSIVVAVAFGAISFLLLFIVPTFAEMYNDFDAELPGPTQFVLSLSNGITDHFFYIVCGAAILAYGMYVFQQSSKGRYLLDKIKIRIPFFGNLFQKTLMSRFCQTLGTLLRSGVILLDALQIIGKASGNTLISEATQEMKQSVKRGGTLTRSLQAMKVFPDMVVQMISVGEETSELDETLLHIAELYEEEVDLAVESLTSIIEPILIVVLGIVLGGIVIAMYLPIFELMNVIQ